MQQQLRQEMWEYWNIFYSSLLSSLFRRDPTTRRKINYEYCSESKQSLCKIWELGQWTICDITILWSENTLAESQLGEWLVSCLIIKGGAEYPELCWSVVREVVWWPFTFHFRIRNYIFLCRESHYTYFVDIHIMYEYEHHTQWWTEIDM